MIFDMIIYLARHGETPWNELGLLQGHNDIPLSPKGEKQAEELRLELEGISFSAAFCSDLSRAKRTAEIVLEGQEIPLIETQLLRETHMGPFEGKHFMEIEQFHQSHHEALKHLPKEEYLAYKKIEGLETYSEVYGRFLKFVEQHASFHPNCNLFVASHGGFIRAILEHYDFSHNLKWKVNNCGYIKLRMEDKKPVIDHMHKVSK